MSIASAWSNDSGVREYLQAMAAQQQANQVHDYLQALATAHDAQTGAGQAPYSGGFTSSGNLNPGQAAAYTQYALGHDSSYAASPQGQAASAAHPGWAPQQAAPQQSLAAAPQAGYKDSRYSDTLNNLGRNRDNALGLIGANENATSLQYGYKTKRNPVTGALEIDSSGGDGGVDPSNPYSQANLLTKSFQEHQRGNTNSYASRGQLYAGSLQNAQNRATDKYNESDNQLRGSFAAAARQYLSQRQGAQTAYDQGAIENEGSAIERHANDPAPEAQGLAALAPYAGNAAVVAYLKRLAGGR